MCSVSSTGVFLKRCRWSLRTQGAARESARRDLEHCANDQEQQDHRPHQDPKDLQGETVFSPARILPVHLRVGAACLQNDGSSGSAATGATVRCRAVAAVISPKMLVDISSTCVHRRQLERISVKLASQSSRTQNFNCSHRLGSSGWRVAAF